jgi:hypothetical protein
MSDKLHIDVTSGEERFLRLDQGYDCPGDDNEASYLPPTCEDRSAGIFEMTNDVGRREIARMKPIGKADVKVRSLVIIPN